MCPPCHLGDSVTRSLSAYLEDVLPCIVHCRLSYSSVWAAFHNLNINGVMSLQELLHCDGEQKLPMCCLRVTSQMGLLFKGVEMVSHWWKRGSCFSEDILKQPWLLRMWKASWNQLSRAPFGETKTSEQRFCLFNEVTSTYTQGYAAIGTFLKSFIFEHDLSSNKDNLSAFVHFPWFWAMSHRSRAAHQLQSLREPPHATLLGVPPASSTPAPISSGAEHLRPPWMGVPAGGCQGWLVLHFENLLFCWALQLLLHWETALAVIDKQQPRGGTCRRGLETSQGAGKRLWLEAQLACLYPLSLPAEKHT